MLAEGTGQRRFFEAFGGNVGVGELQRPGHADPDTCPGPSDRDFGSVRTGVELRNEYRKIAFTSCRASVRGLRDRAISKKIIGRSISIFRDRFSGGRVFLRLMGTLPLLHQPTREHGGGILLNPKVEKSADLLAEIGGMAQAREFVALQRVSRGREKELPRRLGLVMVHAGLLGNDVRKLTVR
jgi:hypothetical protein